MPQLLSNAHCTACQKAQAAANDALLYITGLQEIADVYPDIQERVNELKERQKLLADAARKALEAHRRLSTPG